jgi:hypothetical protein
MCNDGEVNHGRRGVCTAFGNMRIDAAVSAEVLRVIAPLGLEASITAIAHRERTGADMLRQKPPSPTPSTHPSKTRKSRKLSPGF